MLQPGEVEVEWQFDALDMRPVERWLAQVPDRILSIATPAVRDGSAPGTGEAPEESAATLTAMAKTPRRLTDRYIDTDDWRIARAGYVLRLRRRGRNAHVTLKALNSPSASGLRQRVEISQVVEGDPLQSLPGHGEVGSRVSAMAGRRPLRHVLEVRTRRRPFSLRVAGTEVAEMVLDDTTIVLGSGQRPAHLRRVEVEVQPPWVDALAPVVNDLRATCGLRPAELSKFEAGLLASGALLPGPPELGPTTVTPASTVGDVAFAVLRKALGSFLVHEPGTRLGDDPEELHDMRVATRRMRAAMEAFADVLPVRAVALRRELGWVADALGEVRDLDVQLARDELATFQPPGAHAHGAGTGSALSGSSSASSPKTAPDAPAVTSPSTTSTATSSRPAPLDELRAVLLQDWAAARTRMLAVLDSTRYERMVKSLTIMVRQGPSRRSPAARQPAVVVLPELILARHKAVRKAARRAERSGWPADYHRVRIRAKRLRYVVEFSADVYAGETQPFVRRLTRLQDHLGAMQDAEVASSRLYELAVGRHHLLSPETTFVMGAVAERHRAEGQLLLQRVDRRLAALTSKQWKGLRSLMGEERRQALAHARASADHRGTGLGSSVPVVDSRAPAANGRVLGPGTGTRPGADGAHEGTPAGHLSALPQVSSPGAPPAYEAPPAPLPNAQPPGEEAATTQEDAGRRDETPSRPPGSGRGVLPPPTGTETSPDPLITKGSSVTTKKRRSMSRNRGRSSMMEAKSGSPRDAR